jgi:hypothetical protein
MTVVTESSIERPGAPPGPFTARRPARAPSRPELRKARAPPAPRRAIERAHAPDWGATSRAVELVRVATIERRSRRQGLRAALQDVRVVAVADHSAPPRLGARPRAPSPFGRTRPSRVRVLAQDRVQLVLEAAGLDRAVHAALLRCVRLPPPASGARGLVRPDRPRARSAPDRRVAALVERVGRHAVRAEVVPDLVVRPFCEGLSDDRTWSWSISTLRMSVGEAHWSRRSPVTQQPSAASARFSG